jgi:geranylgeranyl diphosphate synthase type II
MYSFEQLQERAIDIIEKEKCNSNPITLYEPIDYTMHQGGKRIRPMITLIAADMFDCDVEKAYNAAIAIEVLHNFTLLHDDIMDASPLRRGKPTVYQKYGTNKAILSGDAMFALAYEYILKYDKSLIPALSKTITAVLIKICEGQAYDMDFENRNDVTKKEYIGMISLKTGVLLAGALKMGAIVAKAKAEDMNLLAEFGLNIGIAFQLKDDELDCWSNLKDFGKVTGTDIADNKKTILYLTAIEKANTQDKQTLLDLYLTKTIDFQKKQKTVRDIFEKNKVREDVEEMIKNYTNKALDALDKVSVEDNKKENLRTFAKKLIDRSR